MAPSHYLNQYWIIVNWTTTNKLQWNVNRNSNIFIQENAFENVVCEMASICLGLNVLTRIIEAQLTAQLLKMIYGYLTFASGAHE